MGLHVHVHVGLEPPAPQSETKSEAVESTSKWIFVFIVHIGTILSTAHVELKCEH